MYGSIAGDTLIFIKGAGFSSLASSNKVYIGNLPCLIDGLYKIYWVILIKKVSELSHVRSDYNSDFSLFLLRFK